MSKNKTRQGFTSLRVRLGRSHHSAQSPKSRWIFLDSAAADPHPTLVGQTPQRHKPHSWAGTSALHLPHRWGPAGLELGVNIPSGRPVRRVAIISFQITKKGPTLGSPHWEEMPPCTKKVRIPHQVPRGCRVAETNEGFNEAPLQMP